jgi:hypothetical protein
MSGSRSRPLSARRSSLRASQPRGGRGRFFGALTIALREENGWRYIGHVGTGFSHEALEELHKKLVKLKTAKSPFGKKVKDEAVTTWVKPLLVAEVKFTEWTSSGEMRHPVYLGLREDKPAEKSCVSTKNIQLIVKRSALAPEDHEHTARLRLNRQLLADGSRRITDFINRPLQLFLGQTEVLEPVVQLGPVLQVYLAAIRRKLVRQARHRGASVMHKKSEKKNDGKGNADQPEKCTFAETHRGLLSDVVIAWCNNMCAELSFPP